MVRCAGVVKMAVPSDGIGKSAALIRHAKMEEDPTFLASYADQPITAKLLIDLAEQGDVHAQSCLSHRLGVGIAI